MTRQTLARSAAGLAAVVAVAGGYAYLQKDMITRAVAAPVAAVTAPAAATAPVAVPAPMDFSGIVERYGPAVVNISTTAHAQRTSMQGLPPGMSPDDPFAEFFKRFMPQMPQQRGDQIVRGLGSGFIVSADGLILTNAHVVDGAQEVNVKLTDRREFKAKVLGVDKQSDVAVLRISAKNLPVVQIGNPANTKVGEPVVAIGSPYGFENTVTAGIVSAKSRSLPDDTYVPFIQTDVAVNPGNSGGPLFNQRGEVIGINSQIYSQTGGYQGLSFAVPIDVAMKVEQQLVATGKVTRGRLGIAVQEVDQSLADSFQAAQARGRARQLRGRRRPRGQGRFAARRRHPADQRRAHRSIGRSAGAGGRHQAGDDGTAAGDASGQAGHVVGDRGRRQGREGGLQRQRCAQPGPPWSGGAAAAAGREAAERSGRRPGRDGCDGPRGQGRDPAGRRDPVAQRYAGVVGAGAAHAGGSRRQACRIARAA